MLMLIQNQKTIVSKVKYSLALIFFAYTQASVAQVLAPSAVEVDYSYTTEVIGSTNHSSPEELANLQASHMFGLFTSPTWVYGFGLDYELAGGMASPRTQMSIKILKVTPLSSGLSKIKYSNKGKLLIHKDAAQNIIAQGELAIPLPTNLENFYDRKCTDGHYQELSDFWYFYDSFRPGCEYLSQAPYAHKVSLQIKPVRRQIDQNASPRLDLVRGNNANGSTFSIYVVNGFADSKTSSRDEGRREAKEFRKYLRQQGFEETVLNRTFARPLSIFKKEILLLNGKTIQVEIKHLLVDTEIESKGITFAKFFKEAVEQADVVIYAGHSGLGANLDIASLEQKAGKFQFNSNKKQIFFFEACSSYSYYLETFAAEKTRAKIDVVTNGLSSYFETSGSIIRTFMDFILNPDIADATWMSVLESMESPLDGGTYLLNVGGL